jgi:hypothetical protein
LLIWILSLEKTGVQCRQLCHGPSRVSFLYVYQYPLCARATVGLPG